mgnify:FL=1
MCSAKEKTEKQILTHFTLHCYFQTFDRIGKMRVTVSSYILNHIPDGTLITLTAFTGEASQMLRITNITGENRRNITNALPLYVSDDTNIAAGLELCREVGYCWHSHSILSKLQTSKS